MKPFCTKHTVVSYNNRQSSKCITDAAPPLQENPGVSISRLLAQYAFYSNYWSKQIYLNSVSPTWMWLKNGGAKTRCTWKESWQKYLWICANICFDQMYSLFVLILLFSLRNYLFSYGFTLDQIRPGSIQQYAFWSCKSDVFKLPRQSVQVFFELGKFACWLVSASCWVIESTENNFGCIHTKLDHSAQSQQNSAFRACRSQTECELNTIFLTSLVTQDSLKKYYVYSYIWSAYQCPSTSTCSTLSAKQSPNRNLEADGIASVLAHELADVASDPLIDAW